MTLLDLSASSPSVASQSANTAELILQPISFDAIPRPAWDRLAAAAPAATPFSRWNFHRAWWDAYGSTAHEQYFALVPSGAEPSADGSEVRAIVPLMHRHAVTAEDLHDRTVLRHHTRRGTQLPADSKAVFLAATYHADYATLLAAPADLPAASAALAGVLASPPDPAHGTQPWDVVDLRRLRTGDPALGALRAALDDPDSDWHLIGEVEDVCPVVTVDSGDWEGYLATLGKKDRHEIRRKLRRAAEVGELTIEVTPPSPEAIEVFIDLHQARFGEDGLFPATAGGERSRVFVHRLAELERAEPDGGQLQVGLVRCGDRLVFAVIAFDDGAACYLYNAGMQPDAAGVSPGVTGMALYIQDRMAAGRRRFDFLRGNEAYKYEWGAKDETIERLLVLRGGLE